MDILTHAIVGGITGWQFGHPVVGAAVAVLPDLAIPLRGSFLQRLKYPPELYDFGHSLLFVVLATVVAALLLGSVIGYVVLWALVSHLFLDIPTHGKDWGVRLFYPHKWRYSLGREWEFFNRAWYIGFAYVAFWIIMVLLCLP